MPQSTTDNGKDEADNDASKVPGNLSEERNLDDDYTYQVDDDHFENDHDTNNDINNSRRKSRPSSLAVDSHGDSAFVEQERQDTQFVQRFWTAYDEILILSIFTQIGILCRLLAAYWLKNFDNVFHKDSALFTNLPLNCLSCFVMGLLCSGESLMEIIATRLTSPALQRDLHREASQRLLLQKDDATNDSSNDDNDMIGSRPIGMRRRRYRQRRSSSKDPRINNHSGYPSQQQQQQQFEGQDSAIFNERREVQLLAWERRIRASICLVLFPVKKEDIDIVENYFPEGYRQETNQNYTGREEEERIEQSEDKSNYDHTIDEQNEIVCGGRRTRGMTDLILETELDDISRTSHSEINSSPPVPTSEVIGRTSEKLRNESLVRQNSNSIIRCSSGVDIQGRNYAHGNVHISARQYGQVEGGNIVDYGTRDNLDLDQIISNVATGVSNNISRIGRVNLANGWDVGTSPHEKSEDLTLGLRDGLCGALSSFSSWISSMVNLFRAGQIGQAFVGILLGIQLPIVAYRFGQYVSVYVFVWRCRRENGKDETRGYGIQLHTSNEEVTDENFCQSIENAHRPSFDSVDSSTGYSQRITRTKGRRTVHDEESEIPSIRAIFTAIFLMCLVAQLTSLTFFTQPEDRLLALGLLFSPLGVLARWRMMKFNSWKAGFPIGTFACNVTACALSGTLGTLIAGNPGPRERIALVSIVAGFGGTLSSVARFIVEILSLLDPILFRLDGLYYAIASVLAGLLVSFLFAASVDWADSME